MKSAGRFMFPIGFHAVGADYLARLTDGILDSLAAWPTTRPSWRERLRRRRIRGKTTLFEQRNGARECARRVRQIAAGSLTEANGLVRESGR